MKLYSYIITYLPVILVVLTPFTVDAQIPNGYPTSVDTVGDIIAVVRELVNALIPIAAGVALLGFFWGLAQYIFKAGDKEAKEEGKRIMIWGTVALFLISAIGGIVNFLAGSLGITTGGTISPPGVGGP